MRSHMTPRPRIRKPRLSPLVLRHPPGPCTLHIKLTDGPPRTSAPARTSTIPFRLATRTVSNPIMAQGSTTPRAGSSGCTGRRTRRQQLLQRPRPAIPGPALADVLPRLETNAGAMPRSRCSMAPTGRSRPCHGRLGRPRPRRLPRHRHHRAQHQLIGSYSSAPKDLSVVGGRANR